MKYFIAIDEELLMKLWMLDPDLVVPYSRLSLKQKRREPLGQASPKTDEPTKKQLTYLNPKQAEGG